MTHAPLPPRLPLVDIPEDPASHQSIERLAPGRGILNLHRMMAHAPPLLLASNAMALAFRRDATIERSLAELVILRTSQIMDCYYVWSRHLPLARAAGVAEAALGELARWRDSAAFTATQKTAFAFAEATARGAVFPDDDFAALQRHFSSRQIVELAMLVGFYVSSALFIKALAVPDEKA